jgi:pimeloyl-ACP methyl ester carboxylesterase
MLFVVGADSWMVEPTAQMATANPRTRQVTVPWADHWVPLDNPSGFLDVVGRFLDGKD